MFQVLKKKKYRFVGCLGILWMLLCPEIFLAEDFCCLSRMDGKEMTKEEAESIWQKLMYGDETPDAKDISVTYKCKILEWLEKEYNL